jgi:molybdopterin converting factor small subunit
MHVRILGFAGVRELLDRSPAELELPNGARVGDAWSLLEERFPALAAHRSTTRIARNGVLTDFEERLHDGDEMAILPPVGGG